MLLEDWKDLRFFESRGFVSKRILRDILICHHVMYGMCFSIEYEKLTSVYHPAEMYINDDGTLFSTEPLKSIND